MKLEAVDVHEIVAQLEAGKTLMYPTETCYGLGCDATNPDAVARVYELKGRPKEKSLILIADTLKRMEPYVERTPALEKLANAYWPGAVTAVVPLLPGADLPKGVVANDGTIAFRVSGHPFARRLVAAFQKPIVSTSANISGAPNPYAPEEIKIAADIFVDAGRLPPCEPSTVVRINGEAYEVIRRGSVLIS